MYTTFRINSTKNCRNLTGFRRISTEIPLALTDFENICQNEETLAQFILDPTSLNLSERLSVQDPLMNEFFKLSRNFCYKIDKTRIEILKQLEEENQN